MRQLRKGFRALIEPEGESQDPNEAIKRNIGLILNSRSTLGIEEYLDDDRILTVLEFGIPDFQQKNLRDENILQQFCASVTKAIQYFEPRISDVAVESDKSTSSGPIRLFIICKFNKSTIHINLIFSNTLWKVEDLEKVS